MYTNQLLFDSAARVGDFWSIKCAKTLKACTSSAGPAVSFNKEATWRVETVAELWKRKTFLMKGRPRQEEPRNEKHPCEILRSFRSAPPTS